jgi:hypothetical protein
MYTRSYSSNGSHNGNGTELSRLLTAALVNKQFCELLLANPASALVEGLRGESFSLETEDQELVVSIQATSLEDFALQLTKHRNGNGRHP